MATAATGLTENHSLLTDKSHDKRTPPPPIKKLTNMNSVSEWMNEVKINSNSVWLSDKYKCSNNKHKHVFNFFF